MRALWWSIWCIIWLIGDTCTALPISATTIGDRNAAIIGIVAVLGISVVLGVCVCCRRHNRGFKELENESGSLDPSRSEFPIFRALSSPQNSNYHQSANEPSLQASGNIVAANQNNFQINNSQDGLENNNGPISPADMENIENNNAVDYIANRNEMGAITEQIFSINRNLSQAQQQQSSSPPLPQQTSSPSPSPSSSIDLDIESSQLKNDELTTDAVMDNKLNIEFSINDLNQNNPFHQINIDDVHIEIDECHCNSSSSSTIISSNGAIGDENCRSNCSGNTSCNMVPEVEQQVNHLQRKCEINDLLSNSFATTVEQSATSIDNDEKHTTNILNECNKFEIIKADSINELEKYDSDKCSIDSVNSVEEALRALDFAISGEDSLQPDDNSDDDDDNDNDKFSNESLKQDSMGTTTNSNNASDLQNVLQQFLINTGATNLFEYSSNQNNNTTTTTTTTITTTNTFNINHNNATTYDEILLEKIKQQAKELVDSVIEECQIIINRKTEIDEQKSSPSNGDWRKNHSSFLLNAKHSFNGNENIKNNNSESNDDDQKQIFFLNDENAFNQTIIDVDNRGNISPKNEFLNEFTYCKSTESGDSKLDNLNPLNEEDQSHHTSYNKDFPEQLKCESTNNERNNKSDNDIIEETFLMNISLTTSTPCIQHKFTSDRKQLKHKILFNTDEIIVTENISPVCCNLTFESPESLSEICQKTVQLQHGMIQSTNVENQTFSMPCISNTFTDHNDVNNINCTIDLNWNNTFSTESKPVNVTFNKNETFPIATDIEELEGECVTRKFDRDEMLSVDLSTVTPVNTPIELNYSLDSWDKFISNTMPQQSQCQLIDTNQPCTSAQASCSGWFLHPPQFNTNDTYEINEEDEGDLKQKYDTIRKQLAEALPHARGIIGPPDFPDDLDDDEDDDDDEDSNQKSPVGDENIPAEMVINYKRPLSPIMEESEDETCKTFIMNETKLLDSTSTGCIETGEAIMGVTKTLMASNDTLFNFEDTLGERDDLLFSPRANSQNEYQSKTPTLDGLSTNPTEIVIKSFVPIELTNMDVIVVNELLSPDQPKTFSDETITIEHISSDLSGTVDATITTNTMEEKTCISVHINDDERISEISEPNWDSTSCNVYDLNSFTDLPSLNVQESNGESVANVENLPNINEIVNQTISIEQELTKDNEDLSIENVKQQITESCHPITNISITHQNDNVDYGDQTAFNGKKLNNEIKSPSSQFYNVSKIVETTNENIDPNNLKPNDPSDFIESTKLEINLEAVIREKNILCETDLNSRFIHTEIHLSEKTDLHKHHIPIIPNCIVNKIDIIDDQNCLMVSDDRISQLSGEEDPWAHPIADIRFNGPTNNILCTTTFPLNEWDSDVDDSNSSEEFMYVKGTPTPVPSPDIYKHQLEAKNDRQNLVLIKQPSLVLNDEDIDNVWNTHKDQIPIVTKSEHKSDAEHSDDSNSDIEGEWVPSSWDSMAQPSRSALKSPDKSSSTTKKRRSVAFKKQNYHSVYEYPKETLSLSPSYSDSYIWERPTMSNLRVDTDTEIRTDLNSLVDGFTISSSTRPFHGSQFNAQCHTWPTDTDFSWSQVQNDEQNDKYPTYSEIQIKWPKNMENIFYSNESKEKMDSEIMRPDSGVGESAELLSESLSLGDLCHTKSSLTLPIKAVPVPETSPSTTTTTTTTTTTNSTTTTKTVTTDVTNTLEHCTNTSLLSEDAFKELKENHHIVSTTPSCTGSMDSLSSSSGSERQVSFTTFGKTSNSIFDDNHLNEKDLKPALVLIESNVRCDVDCTTIKKKHDDHRSTKQQNDSTDEDSGIESIVRKENV